MLQRKYNSRRLPLLQAAPICLANEQSRRPAVLLLPMDIYRTFPCVTTRFSYCKACIILAENRISVCLRVPEGTGHSEFQTSCRVQVPLALVPREAIRAGRRGKNIDWNSCRKIQKFLDGIGILVEFFFSHSHSCVCSKANGSDWIQSFVLIYLQ